ncbi:hypothetical protein UPYG_G00043270 [Umbra pygmaea]|uniref:C-type lectin domain-containing protein n=1 Tax=Umbra pygmaea TaxID=75934 RepID=A0ABD0XTA5_UMBPY
MNVASLTVIVLLLWTNMAVRTGQSTLISFHHRPLGDAAVPLHFQKAKPCTMPNPCNVTGYKDWYKTGSYCIKYFMAHLNFTEAEMQCRSAAPGGHLVSVHDCKANVDLLCVVMKYNAKNPRIWLGGFELFQTGKLMWTDGSPWNYEDWVPGEPSQRWTNAEDCVEMNWSQIGRWNDHSCYTQKSYVCSFKNTV